MRNIIEYLSTKVKTDEDDYEYCIVYPHNNAWTEFNEHQYDDVQFFTSGGRLSLFLFTKKEAMKLLDKYSDNDVWLFEVTKDFENFNDINDYIRAINRKVDFTNLKRLETD